MSPADLQAIREYCINNGIPAEELDVLEEPPVIGDIGRGLMSAMVNDDNIGADVVSLYMLVFDLMARIETLEGR